MVQNALRRRHLQRLHSFLYRAFPSFLFPFHVRPAFSLDFFLSLDSQWEDHLMNPRKRALHRNDAQEVPHGLSA